MLIKSKNAKKLLVPVIMLLTFTFQSAVHAEYQIVLNSGDVAWTFDIRAGLRLVRIQQTSGGKEHTIIDHPAGRRLFDLAVTKTLPAKSKMNDDGRYDWQPGPGLIDPEAFIVTKAKSLKIDGKNAVEFDMRADTSAGDIIGSIRVVAQGNGEVVFFVEIESASSENYLKTTLRGPILENIYVGNDAWYFFPRGHGFLNSLPCRLSTFYGQYAMMQCMGSYGKDTGLVLSMVPLEHEAQPKIFITQKAGEESSRIVDNSYDTPLNEDLLSSSGITQTIVWPDWVAEIGKGSAYGPIAVRIRDNGNWRDIYAHYREYLQTWWEPKPDSHKYVRYSYHEAGSHANCADTTQEWVDWGLPFHDWVEGFLTKPMSLSRYLDYSLLGFNHPERIRQVYEERRNKGIRSTVYVHAKAIDPRDEFSIQNSYDLTLATPPVGEAGGGPPGTGATDGLHWMNLHAEKWREWLGDVCTDIIQKTDADGIRLDCIGFTMSAGGNGANPRIYTPPTRHDSMLQGSVETVAYIRDALDKVNEDVTLGAENLGTDLMMNILDYSLCYNIWEISWLPKNLTRSPVNYIRFVFPDFKFFEITGEPHWDGTLYGYEYDMAKIGAFSEPENIYRESLNTIVFNGVGVSGWNRSPNHIALLETCSRVLNGNTHCFEGEVLIPEIDTLKNGVFANFFAASDGVRAPRIVTLMNWTREPIDGELVQLGLSPGERVVELMRLNNVTMEDRNKARLSLGPMQAAVLRVVPGEIRAKRLGDSISVEIPDGLRTDQKLIAYIVKPDGEITDIPVKMTGRKTATVSGVGPEDKVAVQLMRLFFPDVLKPKYVIDDVTIIEADRASLKYSLYTHIEGESMKIKEMLGGINSTQMPRGMYKENKLDMAWQLGWSGARQLGWHGNIEGDKLDVTFAAPKKGVYEVFAAFGKGPFYGQYELSINDCPIVPSIDLYDDKSGSSGKVSLGKFELEQDENILDVKCLGLNELSASNRQFDYSRVASACIRFCASTGHTYWLDNIYFESVGQPDCVKIIPDRSQDPLSEGPAWTAYFFVMPDPSLPPEYSSSREFVPSSFLSVDTTEFTAGKQSIKHTNPGWPNNQKFAFGVCRGDGLPWRLAKDWTLHFDVMIHSADDTERELVLVDVNGNRLIKDISAIVPNDGSSFTHVAIKLGDMVPDPRSGLASTFGLDYLQLVPVSED